MPTKIIGTLDPNRLGPSLDLSQGNLVVTTTAIADVNRAVFGTLAVGAGKVAYECYIWSQSQPQAGLVNLVRIGLVADAQCSLSMPVGSQTYSYGLDPTAGAVYNDGVEISSDSSGGIQPIAERRCIGVYLDLTGTTPFAAWFVDGNIVFQCDLPSGYFWLPAISIGSSTAGDIQAQCNFGNNLLDYPLFTVFKGGSNVTEQMSGWVETMSDGIATVYLSLAEEGITTAPTDTPANSQFHPSITNAQTFSIRRAPSAWYEGEDDGQAASYGTLQINNQDGAYDDLLKYDLQDTNVVLQLPTAKALTQGTELADSLVVATAIIDKITEDDNGIITIAIRDTITRLDKVLPTRFVPGFRDSGAAYVMVPLSFGGFRNRSGLLIDAENRLYLLHDGVIPNILKVADMAAPLDPHASPPQYAPALNGYGIQLQVLPQGKLTFDGSSYGTQSQIPGVDDVLNGDGQFLGTWTGSPAVPPNWTWTHNTGSAINELTNPPYTYLGTSNGARLLSRKVFDPSGGSFGDEFVHSYDLQPGSTYRVSFILTNVQQSAPYFIAGMVGGLMLTTAKSLNPSDYITGYTTPLTGNGFSPQHLSFEFTVPQGATRKLYFLVVPSAGNAPNTAQGYTSLEIGDIAIELVGQFVDQPITPLPFADYVKEILVNRAGEDASLFNADEAAEVFQRADGSLKTWAQCFDAPPNILDCLMTPAKSEGYVIFTDALGKIRYRRQLDPRDPANQASVKCDFTEFNMSRPIISDDTADNLTTLFGARPNQDPFSDSDFVTDEAIVSSDTKTRYKRPSQFWVTSSYRPFSQYSAAVNAPIFDTVFDDRSDCQIEADRVVGMFSPKRYSSSSVSTQKRQRLTFTGAYDEPTKLGVNVTCAVPDLMYGDIVKIDYVDKDDDGNVLREIHTYGSVVEWEPLYLANQINLVVRI